MYVLMFVRRWCSNEICRPHLPMCTSTPTSLPTHQPTTPTPTLAPMLVIRTLAPSLLMPIYHCVGASAPPRRSPGAQPLYLNKK